MNREKTKKLLFFLFYIELIIFFKKKKRFLISRGPRAEVTNTLLKRVLELKSGLKTN